MLASRDNVKTVSAARRTRGDIDALRVGPLAGLGAAEVVALDGVEVGAFVVADWAVFDHDLARRVWAAFRARASLRWRCSACAAS